MGAINTVTVRLSEAQLCSRQTQTETATPLAFLAPSSSTGGVTLEAIMAQLVHMDACLDTLSDKLCQVNTRAGLITQQQAVMGGYTMASSLEASEDESNGSSSADDAEDDDDGSPSDDEMST